MSNNNSSEDKNVKMLLIVIVVGLVLYLLVGYFGGNGLCGFRNRREGFQNLGLCKDGSIPIYPDDDNLPNNIGEEEVAPFDENDVADNAAGITEDDVNEEFEGFQNNSKTTNDDGVQSSDGNGNNEDYGEVPQSNNKNELPNECYPKDVLSAGDLLPGDANSKFAQTNPNGQGSLSDKNFLTAGFHVGTNTVGQSLRNANRQLRSDPPNPQVKVSPWMQTTIEPDVNRQPMEIGGN
jgi:hypothetical protein